MSWDVIVWKNEKAIDFVPSSWSNADKTSYKYPLFTSEIKIRQYIYKCRDLTDDYEWYQASVKKCDIKSLEKAKEICEKGKFTSNIDTSDDGGELCISKRKRKRTKKYFNDSEYEVSSDSSGDDNIRSSKKNKKQVDVHVGETRKTFKVPATPPKPKIIIHHNEVLSKSPLRDISETNDNEDDELPENLSFASNTTLTNYSGPNFPTDFMKEMLRNQAGLKFEIKLLRKKLEKLENIYFMQSPQSINESIFVTKLPCEKLVHLEEVENLISQDKQKLNELVNFLSLAGGETIQKTVYALLKKLMTNEVALQFSGQGKKQKLAFSKLSLNKAVVSATRQRHTNATDEELKKFIGLYLAQTKARMNASAMKKVQENIIEEK